MNFLIFIKPKSIILIYYMGRQQLTYYWINLLLFKGYLLNSVIKDEPSRKIVMCLYQINCVEWEDKNQDLVLNHSSESIHNKKWEHFIKRKN